VTFVAPAVFAFYVVIIGNFLSNQLMGCRMQELLTSNLFIMHLVGFLMLFFVVILVDPANADKNLIANLGIAVVVYAWFVMSSKTHIYFSITTICILLAVYIINAKRLRYAEEKNEEQANKHLKIQKFLVVAAGILTLVGLAIYIVEKKSEYKDEFSLVYFLFGTPRCRNYTPRAAKLLKVPKIA
jgi:Ca2+/Na+ antiporter